MNKAQFVLILAAFLSYLSSFFLSFLGATGLNGVFYNNLSVLDKKYFQQVSPEPIAFGIIWPLIYLWNLVGVLYIVVSCCLPVDKSPVKITPTLVPKTFLISYCVTFLSMSLWLFAFDREMLGPAFAILLLSAVSAYVAVGVSCKAVTDNLKILERKYEAVLWLVRILVQNGLSFLGTWLTVATLLNLTTFIIYKDSFGLEAAVLRGDISMINGSTLILFILLAIVIIWFALENFVFEKYLRYIYTVYPVLIFALSFLIVKLAALPDGNQNLIIASLDLAVVVIAFTARITLEVLRNKHRGVPL
uniref:Uncharacterized protein LOC100186076 n=1 Tax=Phallusia mammillata TaxID=59560 RepID=A0A6F9DIL0_9ASCI|nr:uncharacterized protein LOC100186076 [Phallusia mammillata]